jgi:GNAT superfamily N-acetyltransferase
MSEKIRVIIRRAAPQDAELMAYLCHQLGYPAEEQHIQQRLTVVMSSNDHAVFVAEQAGLSLGWVHVFRCHLLHTAPEAQIGGLIIDATVRRSGVGQRLMQAAEQWAQAQDCWAVYLRSHIERQDAHQFYHKIGYETVSSSVFRKRL